MAFVSSSSGCRGSVGELDGSLRRFSDVLKKETDFLSRKNSNAVDKNFSLPPPRLRTPDPSCFGDSERIEDVQMEVPYSFVLKVQAILTEMGLEMVKKNANLFVIENSQPIGRFTVNMKIRDLKDNDWKAKIFPKRDDNRNLQIIFVKANLPNVPAKLSIVFTRAPNVTGVPLQRVPPTLGCFLKNGPSQSKF
ncbi:MAG: hypothetical protein JSR39_04260 [Verrucomicrobia bacterium]|nr:hypothetical protein [Verrucomicrobiota bacterium]